MGGRARGCTDEFTADHLAAALGVSLRSATNRIHEAEALRDYPRILAALGAGLVSMAGVRAFLREVSGLDLVQHPGHAAAVETHVLNQVGEPFLPVLGTWTAEGIGELPFADVAALMGAVTPGQVTTWTRRAVVLADKDAARKRTQKASGSRRSSSVVVAGSGWRGSGGGCRRRKPRPGTSGSTAKPGAASTTPTWTPGAAVTHCRWTGKRCPWTRFARKSSSTSS